jgi:hypothetical protein
MGSWNNTCGLSNLHITSGTPVYVFVLEKNTHYNPCYSTSLFSPLLLPFESTYDDYGGGEDSHGVALDLIIEGIKNELVEMEVGKNQYHDIAVKKEGFTPEKFFEAVREDRLKIRSYRNEEKPVYFTMFRKDIVDDILDTRVTKEYVGNGKGTCGWDNNYIKVRFADIAANVRPLLEKLVLDNEGKDEYMTAFIMDKIHNYRDDFLAAQWLNGDGHRYSRLVDIKRLIGEAVAKGTFESVNNIEPLIVEHLKGVYIDSFMHDARKIWIPGGHEGSQGYSGGALRILSAATIRALNKEKAEWLADYECDEDEYLEE